MTKFFKERTSYRTVFEAEKSQKKIKFILKAKFLKPLS